MNTKQLREQIELLREFMHQPASYPGPEPGKTWSVGMSYAPSMRAAMFPHLANQEADKKKFKDKGADKRDALRKLAIWLQKGAQ